MMGCPSSCDFFPWIQCRRWPGPYDPQERFRGIAELPKDQDSVKEGALAGHRLAPAASSPGPPRSDGVGVRRAGAYWRISESTSTIRGTDKVRAQPADAHPT